MGEAGCPCQFIRPMACLDVVRGFRHPGKATGPGFLFQPCPQRFGMLVHQAVKGLPQDGMGCGRVCQGFKQVLLRLAVRFRIVMGYRFGKLPPLPVVRVIRFFSGGRQPQVTEERVGNIFFAPCPVPCFRVLQVSQQRFPQEGIQGYGATGKGRGQMGRGMLQPPYGA